MLLKKPGRNDTCTCPEGRRLNRKAKRCCLAPKPPRREQEGVCWILSVPIVPEGDEIDDEDNLTEENFHKLHEEEGVFFPATDKNGKWLAFRASDAAYQFADHAFPGLPRRAILVLDPRPELSDQFIEPKNPTVRAESLIHKVLTLSADGKVREL